MIRYTITCTFENEEQRDRFLARLNGVGVVSTEDAKALIEAEREACARIADAFEFSPVGAAIRARGLTLL